MSGYADFLKYADWANLGEGGSIDYPVGALADIGETTPLPFVVLAMGQSNMVGRDSNGSKVIGANIFCTNDFINPTAIVPAAFGTAPLYNTSPGNATGATAAAACNNQAVHFANALRASGMIAAERPIVIVFNCVGGQSITQWVGTGTSSAYWTSLIAALALVTAAYPGAKINHVLWDQAESDNNASGTSFNSKAKYLAGFATLLAQLRALPMWQAGVKITATELGAWNNNTQQDRNDALYTLRDGQTDPYVTLVSGAGLAQSTQQPPYHYDGAALVTLGQRHFASWAKGRLLGAYAPAVQSASGSAHVFKDSFSVAAAGTLKVDPDSLRGGGAAINCAGAATITLPPGTYAPTASILMQLAANVTLTSTSNITGDDGTTGTSITTNYAVFPVIARVYVKPDGTWAVESIGPRIGRVMPNNIGNISAATTLTATQVQNAIVQITASNIALTLPTPSAALDGALLVVYNSGLYNSSTVTSSDGIYVGFSQKVTSYTLVPSSIVRFMCFRGHWINIDDTSISSAFTNTVAPASGATVTSLVGIGRLTTVINPAGTLAALTIGLPAYAQDGSTVTYFFTQAITALSFSAGTVVGGPTSAAANSKFTLTYSASLAKWY